MTSHYPYLAEFCERLGVPAIFPEPETTAAALAKIQCKTLAGIIADLLNEHEPLLKAAADGDVICVSEKGGDLVFAVTVDPQSRGAVRANDVPADKNG